MNIQLLKRDVIINLMFSPYKKGRTKINTPQYFGDFDEENYDELISLLSGNVNPFNILDIAEGIFKKYCKLMTGEVPISVIVNAYPRGSSILLDKNNSVIVKYITSKHRVDKQKYDSFFIHENISQYIAIAFKKEFVTYFNSLGIIDINTFYYLLLKNPMFDRIF